MRIKDTYLTLTPLAKYFIDDFKNWRINNNIITLFVDDRYVMNYFGQIEGDRYYFRIKLKQNA